MSPRRRDEAIELPKLDRWIQRVTTAAMLAMALTLVGLGVALYAPGAQAGSPARSSAAAP